MYKGRGSEERRERQISKIERKVSKESRMKMLDQNRTVELLQRILNWMQAFSTPGMPLHLRLENGLQTVMDFINIL